MCPRSPRCAWGPWSVHAGQTPAGSGLPSPPRVLHPFLARLGPTEYGSAPRQAAALPDIDQDFLETVPPTVLHRICRHALHHGTLTDGLLRALLQPQLTHLDLSPDGDEGDASDGAHDDAGDGYATAGYFPTLAPEGTRMSAAPRPVFSALPMLELLPKRRCALQQLSLRGASHLVAIDAVVRALSR